MKAMRLITYIHYEAHTDHLFKSLQYWKIRERSIDDS